MIFREDGKKESVGLSGLRRRRMTVASIVPLFLAAALAPRSCPHHDALPAQAEHTRDFAVGVHAGHGVAADQSGETSETVPHACLCVDQCEMGVVPDVAPSTARIAAQPVERAATARRPEPTPVEQHTRYLIPLPNAPPCIV